VILSTSLPGRDFTGIMLVLFIVSEAASAWVKGLMRHLKRKAESGKRKFYRVRKAFNDENSITGRKRQGKRTQIGIQGWQAASVGGVAVMANYV
jgi:hypothetical protein